MLLRVLVIKAVHAAMDCLIQKLKRNDMKKILLLICATAVIAVTGCVDVHDGHHHDHDAVIVHGPPPPVVVVHP
jgi:hypothetical protein